MRQVIILGLLLASACWDNELKEIPSTRPDAYVAPTTPDGSVTTPGDACVSQTQQQLLVNGNFDSTPVGTGWTLNLAEIDSPLITDDDGADAIAEDSPSYKAWIGGYAPGGGALTDSISQSVVVPNKTTTLVLTGKYQVRTEEETASPVYDVAKVIISEENVGIIGSLVLSNQNVTTAWTDFTHTFTQNWSGKTLRIKLTSTVDALDSTSFYFDSLALNATVNCQ